jgi:hypothetical protein
VEALKIVDGKVYNAEDVLLGDLDRIDEVTNTVYVRGGQPSATELQKLKDDLKEALRVKAKQPLEQVSYQIMNQGARPKRNGPCPNHPKIKFKNCPCSRKDWNINLVSHRK